MFLGSSSRPSTPTRFTDSLLLGLGVPIVFVYLPDEAPYLGEREEFPSILIRRLAYRSNGSLILEDPDRLKLVDDLQVGVLEPMKHISIDNECLQALHSLVDISSTLLQFL